MTDRELKAQVENALDWEPSVDARDVGVAVANLKFRVTRRHSR